MKIGIVTFYSECNYGAFLQALGSKTYLESLGHEVEFINYNPAKDVSIWLKFGLHDGTFWNKIKRRYNIYIKYQLHAYCEKYLDGFSKARKQFFTETKKINENSIDSILHNFDCIYVGSDQVWNMRKAGKEKLFYFLNFFKSGKIRKISYAACFGQKYQTPELIPYIKNALRDFNAISVRNDVSAELVKEYIGIEVPIVCDPTILLGDYRFAESDYVTKYQLKDYILVYCLDDRQEKKHEEAITFLRQKYHKTIVTITSSHHTAWSLSGANITIYDATPMDWLNLFHNASIVYTDSYHGAIFSLLYHHDLFIMIDNNERASRLKDLAERYGLSKRLCITNKDLKEATDNAMEWASINTKLSTHRNMSIEYLKTALQ